MKNIKNLNVRCENCREFFLLTSREGKIICPHCGSEYKRKLPDFYENTPKKKAPTEDEKQLRKKARVEFFHKSRENKIASGLLVIIGLLLLFSVFCFRVTGTTLFFASAGFVMLFLLLGHEKLPIPYRSGFAWLLVISVVMCVFGVSKFQNKPAIWEKPQIPWENTHLGDRLPSEEFYKGVIYEDTTGSLSISVKDISKNEFSKFVNLCKKEGYIYDTKFENYVFTALDAEEYILKLSYDSKNNLMNVKLRIPMDLPALEWPRDNMAAMIPKPDSDRGKVMTNKPDELVIHVAKINSQKFNAYAAELKKAGFTEEDHFSPGSYFSGKNKEGNWITIMMYDHNIMNLSLYRKIR